MNVLVIGSGGREHAIALKINQSKKLKSLFCIPGNPGTNKFATNFNISLTDYLKISDFCNSKEVIVICKIRYLTFG